MDPNLQCKYDSVMQKLTEKELAEYTKSFGLLIKNEAGVVTIDELRIMVRTLGENPTEAELEETFKASDIDGNGKIDFKEFCLVMHRFERDEKRQLCEAFKMFDQDGDGYIGGEDLVNVWKSMNIEPKNVLIERMLKAGDVDGDGKISCTEFLTMMQKPFGQKQLPGRETSA
ncbi:calmodulin-like [Drosophila subobscura]|uniref:calmodulin-like n=1 Tax=Drosophila subobscura TaxID=7241 RepID=UPI00155AECDE|nr:calmodulin-like [Drosophila subobscura]